MKPALTSVCESYQFQCFITLFVWIHIHSQYWPKDLLRVVRERGGKERSVSFLGPRPPSLHMRHKHWRQRRPRNEAKFYAELEKQQGDLIPPP